MRPIDADRLKDTIYFTCDLGGWLGEALSQIKKTAIKYIENAPTIATKQVKYYDEDENVWKIGEVIVNSSEKPNNCEHITEDGVTCAKYPACDDCLDNPLNKVKGSERLVKGSEQTEPTISKMEQVETMSCQECKHFHENAVMYLDQCDFCFKDCKYEPKDEPQTERSE